MARTVWKQQRDRAARLRHASADMEDDDRGAERGGGRRRLCHCRDRQCDETGKDNETGCQTPVRSRGVQMVGILLDHVALAISMNPWRRKAQCKSGNRFCMTSGSPNPASTLDQLAAEARAIGPRSSRPCPDESCSGRETSRRW